MWNSQGRGNGYQPKPKTGADDPNRDLDYPGYHKNLIQLFINVHCKFLYTVPKVAVADLWEGPWRPGFPRILGKIDEMTEGRKASRVSKSKPGPLLAQDLDPPLCCLEKGHHIMYSVYM